MPLCVVVQMDPIDRINIRGDSTFALLLEAQRRGFEIAYYTPAELSMRDGQVVSDLEVRARLNADAELAKLREEQAAVQLS